MKLHQLSLLKESLLTRCCFHDEAAREASKIWPKGAWSKVSAQVTAVCVCVCGRAPVENTRADGTETIPALDATARCCRLVPAVPRRAPVVRWAAAACNDTQTAALHTLICPITTAIITSATCDSADLCRVCRRRLGLRVCVCVHRTGMCLPFGGMYSIW